MSLWKLATTRPQTNTTQLNMVHMTLTDSGYTAESYLFFAFILETQTSGSFLEALAIIRPGLVRL